MSNKKEDKIYTYPLFVGLLGFEPRQTESKSVVLPLHHNPNLPRFNWECKNKGCEKMNQMYFLGLSG